MGGRALRRSQSDRLGQTVNVYSSFARVLASGFLDFMVKLFGVPHNDSFAGELWHSSFQQHPKAVRSLRVQRPIGYPLGDQRSPRH